MTIMIMKAALSTPLNQKRSRAGEKKERERERPPQPKSDETTNHSVRTVLRNGDAVGRQFEKKNRKDHQPLLPVAKTRAVIKSYGQTQSNSIKKTGPQRLENNGLLTQEKTDGSKRQKEKRKRMERRREGGKKKKRPRKSCGH